MFCTGGIRCEKASNFLIKNGYNNIFQLKGGIIEYLKSFACRSAITYVDTKSRYFKLGVSCPKCFKEKSKKQKAKYEERQKQMQIAKKKGIKHLGS